MLKTVKQRGFTIVELLIVVVIIGILAAIVIVAYNGITNRAHDSAVESDLALIVKKLEIYKANNGSYPNTEADLDAADFKVTKASYLVRNNLYYCRSTDGQHYAVGAYSVSNSRYWVKDGTITKTTSAPSGAGTCAYLDPIPNSGTQNAYGLHDNSGTITWRSWTE